MSASDGSEEEALQVVRHYHHATKHFPIAYAKGPGSLDWDAQPNPFRHFAGTQQIPLTLGADKCTLPVQAFYTPLADPSVAKVASAGQLAKVLELSLAVSAWKQYGDARWALRCNPSSGNLHPTEAYVLAINYTGLANGVYHYNPEHHALELRCQFHSHPSTSEPQLLIGLSSVHWREAWKYGERAYRYCQLDVGHALGALSYAAHLAGLPARVLDEPSSQDLAQLFGTNRQSDYGNAEPEWPDALVQLLPVTAQGACSLQEWLSLAQSGQWSGLANVLDRRHFYRWPIIDEVANACLKPATANTQLPWRKLPPARHLNCAEPAARLVRQRRSAQAFDCTTPISQEDFYSLLDHLLPRPELPPWTCASTQPCVHLVLFVHRVTGLAAGLYALPRRLEAKALMQSEFKTEFSWEKVEAAPEHLPLYHLITGKAERMAARLACQQAIASDSAFAVAMLAEMDSSLKGSPWRYNQLYQEAGLIGQSLYIDAEAIGLRGTGIGCFFDEGVHEVLGIQGEQLQSLYHFTLGGPIVDTRIISLPPYAHRAL